MLNVMRRAARVLAVAVLYQVDMAGIPSETAIANAIREIGEAHGTRYDRLYLRSLVLGTLENQDDIDDLAAKQTNNWSLQRMGRIERSILRLATYELKCEQSVPVRVVLNEAIELAKLYADERSAKFVNGVLAGIAKDLRQGELD